MTSPGGLLSRYDVTLQLYLSGYAFHVESDIQKRCNSRRKKGCLKMNYIGDKQMQGLHQFAVFAKTSQKKE